MLLTRAEIEDKDERTFILTRLNHNDPDTMNKQMKTQILELMDGNKEDGGTFTRQ